MADAQAESGSHDSDLRTLAATVSAGMRSWPCLDYPPGTTFRSVHTEGPCDLITRPGNPDSHEWLGTDR